MNVIGRNDEIKELNRLYESSQSELVAVYGRRRVGKTFLINEVFKDKYSFKHTGLSTIKTFHSTPSSLILTLFGSPKREMVLKLFIFFNISNN